MCIAISTKGVKSEIFLHSNYALYLHYIKTTLKVNLTKLKHHIPASSSPAGLLRFTIIKAKPAKITH